MRRFGWMAGMVLLLAVTTRSASAQLPSSDRPVSARDTRDITYSARLALSDLAVTIRRGEVDRKLVNDPALSLALNKLVMASGRHSDTPPPRPEFGPLWDFRFEVLSVDTLGGGKVRVTTRAFLATSDDHGEALGILMEQRGQASWAVVGQEGLAARLQTMATNLAQAPRRAHD